MKLSMTIVVLSLLFVWGHPTEATGYYEHVSESGTRVFTDNPKAVPTDSEKKSFSDLPERLTPVTKKPTVFRWMVVVPNAPERSEEEGPATIRSERVQRGSRNVREYIIFDESGDEIYRGQEQPRVNFLR